MKTHFNLILLSTLMLAGVHATISGAILTGHRAKMNAVSSGLDHMSPMIAPILQRMVYLWYYDGHHETNDLAKDSSLSDHIQYLLQEGFTNIKYALVEEKHGANYLAEMKRKGIETEQIGIKPEEFTALLDIHGIDAKVDLAKVFRGNKKSEVEFRSLLHDFALIFQGFNKVHIGTVGDWKWEPTRRPTTVDQIGTDAYRGHWELGEHTLTMTGTDSSLLQEFQAQIKLYKRTLCDEDLAFDGSTGMEAWGKLQQKAPTLHNRVVVEHAGRARQCIEVGPEGIVFLMGDTDLFNQAHKVRTGMQPRLPGRWAPIRWVRDDVTTPVKQVLRLVKEDQVKQSKDVVMDYYKQPRAKLDYTPNNYVYTQTGAKLDQILRSDIMKRKSLLQAISTDKHEVSKEASRSHNSSLGQKRGASYIDQVTDYTKNHPISAQMEAVTFQGLNKRSVYVSKQDQQKAVKNFRPRPAGASPAAYLPTQEEAKNQASIFSMSGGEPYFEQDDIAQLEAWATRGEKKKTSWWYKKLPLNDGGRAVAFNDGSMPQHFAGPMKIGVDTAVTRIQQLMHTKLDQAPTIPQELVTALWNTADRVPLDSVMSMEYHPYLSAAELDEAIKAMPQDPATFLRVLPVRHTIKGKSSAELRDAIAVSDGKVLLLAPHRVTKRGLALEKSARAKQIQSAVQEKILRPNKKRKSNFDDDGLMGTVSMGGQSINVNLGGKKAKFNEVADNGDVISQEDQMVHRELAQGVMRAMFTSDRISNSAGASEIQRRREAKWRRQQQGHASLSTIQQDQKRKSAREALRDQTGNVGMEACLERSEDSASFVEAGRRAMTQTVTAQSLLDDHTDLKLNRWAHPREGQPATAEQKVASDKVEWNGKQSDKATWVFPREVQYEGFTRQAASYSDETIVLEGFESVLFWNEITDLKAGETVIYKGLMCKVTKNTTQLDDAEHGKKSLDGSAGALELESTVSALLDQVDPRHMVRIVSEDLGDGYDADWIVPKHELVRLVKVDGKYRADKSAPVQGHANEMVAYPGRSKIYRISGNQSGATQRRDLSTQGAFNLHITEAGQDFVDRWAKTYSELRAMKTKAQEEKQAQLEAAMKAKVEVAKALTQDGIEKDIRASLAAVDALLRQGLELATADQLLREAAALAAETGKPVPATTTQLRALMKSGKTPAEAATLMRVVAEAQALAKDTTMQGTIPDATAAMKAINAVMGKSSKTPNEAAALLKAVVPAALQGSTMLKKPAHELLVPVALNALQRGM